MTRILKQLLIICEMLNKKRKETKEKNILQQLQLIII